MEREQLLAAIAAQEQLRGIVPDEVVDATISTLRAQLREKSDTPQRRRQVTVLFADVSGFTAMSESLDPEVVTGLMNELWARLDRVVVDSGGRIDKHIGDALMAVWGAEVTAEDDAEQAVRAALGLQTELEHFRAVSGRDLGMRVGVNTGPVLVGPVGSTQEFTVMGDTVNTASRLEHAAPRKGVLISHDTYRQVRGVFDVDVMEPLAVKGKADLLRVYLAKSEKARAFRLRNRGVEGVETATIGRDNEFAELCRAFEQMTQTGQGKAVVLIGDAGVGKSRLLYEFDNWLELHEEAVFYFKARGHRARSQTRLGLWRDLLAFRAGVIEGDPASEVLKKLRIETAGVLDDREAAILGLWLGFELPDRSVGSQLVSGENLGAVGKVHLWAFLGSLLIESPVVMLFEDLHWADEASLALLEELVAQYSDDRLLIVGASRPERSRDGLALDVLGPSWQPISLASLDDGPARALVAEILKRLDHQPEALVDLIVERADGNPFYVEELIKKLIDDGCIITDTDNEWTMDIDQLDEDAIPGTLTGVLQARFDRLTESQRWSLQRASIVGRTFWDSAIEALGSETTDLDRAVRIELVFPRQPSSFPQTAEYAFKHALLHDVAYDTVLLSERPALHQRAAEWLTTVVGERRDEYLEEIAGHLLLADQQDQAAGLLIEAAERALHSGDASSARRLAASGMSVGESVTRNSKSHRIVADACRLRGEFATGEQEADLAIRIAEAEQDDEALVAAIGAWFLLAEVQGANEQCRSLVQRGLPVAERLGGSSLANMLRFGAWSALNAGDVDGAQTNAAASLQLAEASGDVHGVEAAHSVLGVIASIDGRHDEAVAHHERVLELATKLGDLSRLAVCRLNMGATWHYLADMNGDHLDYDKAKIEYEEALALTRRLGLRAHEIRTLLNLAQLAMRRNQYDEATAIAKDGLSAAVALHSHADSLFAILVHAETTYEATGDQEQLAHIGAVRADPELGRLSAEISDVIDRLRSSHPGVNIDRLIDAGGRLSLDNVVRQILGQPRG